MAIESLRDIQRAGNSAFAAGGGGLNAGTATIDFGSWPGTNEASVTVTGQTGIVSGSVCGALLIAETSGSHTPADAAYAAMFITLTCSAPTAGTGFAVYARSRYKMTGTFSIKWFWS
jgi:hypothetical protein